jgi:DNA-binding response OmpR family regulator
MHVLVVEDDPATRHLTRRVLDREGFTVVEAADGGDALRAASAGGIDVALIDRGLPDISGLDVIDGLRRFAPDVHIIIISGASSEVERVEGLIAGADDYLVKPFSLRELVARLLAVQRRRAERSTTTGEPEGSELAVGELVIDLRGRTVSRGGQYVDLTRKEFDLLKYMAGHPGISLSRDRLLEAVWASSASWQSSATVTEHMRRLRTKIESDPARPTVIVTVRGEGYRLDIPA